MCLRIGKVGLGYGDNYGAVVSNGDTLEPIEPNWDISQLAPGFQVSIIYRSGSKKVFA